jgi:anti-sigma regulatory factor (Ser/Thr protein kinase)
MNQHDRVVLTLPARGEYARTARLTAAELASRIGMSIDGVDDMKMAVEEAFVFVTDRRVGETVTFDFTIDEGIEILVGPMEGSCAEQEGETGERYARFILESVCDEFSLVDAEVGCFVRLVKRMA